MTKAARNGHFHLFHSLCFPSCFPSRLRKAPRNPVPDRVFIVLEHPEGWGGAPDDVEEIVLGVFFDQERATDCVRTFASYYYSRWGSRLTVEDGMARDEQDIPLYQILERYIT